jgi:uncharacterized protein YbjT (DUF2867 family)
LVYLREQELEMANGLKVLVYGATGSQAGPIAPKLLAAGHKPYALTRSAERGAALKAAGAELVVADMGDEAALRAASEGMDVVALMLPAFGNPAEQPVYLRNAVEGARAAGVKLIVYNTSGPVIPQRIGHPMYDSRHDVLDYLRASGVPTIVIQPTVYLENLLGLWTRQGIVERNELAYPMPDQLPLGWIATDDVAAFIAAAVERPELAGSHMIVSGAENLTGSALAARFSEGIGRTIRYRQMPVEEFGAFLNAAFGPGTGAAGAAGYRFQQENAALLPTWAPMDETIAKLPVRLTSVAEWAARMAPLFTK